MLILDCTYTEMVARLRPELRTVRHFVIATDEQHMPARGGTDEWLCYDALLARARPLQRWPQVDERSACGMCYTSGGHHCKGQDCVASSSQRANTSAPPQSSAHDGQRWPGRLTLL